MTTHGARRFQLHACVGMGGFGEVYRASMVSTGGLEREVAVKTLRPSVAPDDDAVRRLRDEARLLARLQHRAILSVHDIVHLAGRIALVTDYLDGEDVASCIVGPHALSRRAAVEVVGEVASALAAAHQNLELVHRDIKPSNIRLLSDGSVRLLDFGIARSPRVAREGHTTTGMIVGTPGYLAPERVAEGVDGPASDIYSLGCVLYATLARVPLFHEVPRSRMLGIALDADAHDAFIRERFASLPDGPDTRLLRAMLSAMPARRPSAARIEELCEDIAPELSGEPLRRWARNRTWRAPPEVVADLVGQTLVEEPSGRAPVAKQPAAFNNSTVLLPDPAPFDPASSQPVALPDDRPLAEPLPPQAPAPVSEPAVPASAPRRRPAAAEDHPSPPSRPNASPARRAPTHNARVLPARTGRRDSGSSSTGAALAAGVFGAALLAGGVLAIAASQGALGEEARRAVDDLRKDALQLVGER